MEEEKKDLTQEQMMTETPEEQQSETPVKSAKDSFREGYGAEHPDLDMEDEEAFYTQLGKDRDTRVKNQKDFDAINGMMAENPNAGYFMSDLFSGKTGEDLAASFIENFGDTFKNAIDDPSEENVKKFADAMKKNADKIREDEEFQQQWAANDEGSQQTVEQFAKDKGLDEEAKNNLITKITDFVGKFASGIIDSDMLEAVYKLGNYDSDMAEAEKRGEATGRNTRIRENIRKSAGDGVPLMQGGNTSSQPEKKKKSTIFDLANNAR